MLNEIGNTLAISLIDKLGPEASEVFDLANSGDSELFIGTTVGILLGLVILSARRGKGKVAKLASKIPNEVIPMLPIAGFVVGGIIWYLKGGGEYKVEKWLHPPVIYPPYKTGNT